MASRQSVAHLLDESLKRECGASLTSGGALTKLRRLRGAARRAAFEHEISVAGCRAARMLRQAVDEMGNRLVVDAGDGAWKPLEGSSPAAILAQNPDPLAALQRGEIPAIVLRNAAARNRRDVSTHAALLTGRIMGSGWICTPPRLPSGLALRSWQSRPMRLQLEPSSLARQLESQPLE